VAVGSLALSGGVRNVVAQAAKRIESLAPELDKIIALSEPNQELADGFGGPLGPAEGPVWWKEGGYLLFSDIHNNRRMKYVPGQGVSVVQEPTNRANGLTRDLQGRLLACEHDSRRVTRQELDGSLTVIANSFQGVMYPVAADKYRRLTHQPF
jgi:gluconolactonase